DGKRHRPKVLGTTKADARAKLRALALDHAAGRPLPAGKETVGAYLARWLTTVVEPSVAPSTLASQRMIVNRHLTPALGRRPLAQLSPADIQTYVAEKAR